MLDKNFNKAFVYYLLFETEQNKIKWKINEAIIEPTGYFASLHTDIDFSENSEKVVYSVDYIIYNHGDNDKYVLKINANCNNITITKSISGSFYEHTIEGDILWVILNKIIKSEEEYFSRIQ